MFKTAPPIIALAFLGACADISRIDTETTAPMPSGATAMVAQPSATITGPQGTQSHLTLPPQDPLTGARDAQTWRLTQQNTAIRRLPQNQPVPQIDLEELRRQRMQAQALAAAGMPPHPTLGPGSGNTDFLFPAPIPSAAMSGAIPRATATEADALTR